jgi:hypothetical protein
MRNLLMAIVVASMSWIHNAEAQSATVDPESIVPLPDKFEMETPAPDVPPAIARFHGAWIGTWADDVRHVLVVERVRPDGRANVIFAHADSAFYGMTREWSRSEAKIADGVLTFTGEALRIEPDGTRPIMLEATWYRPAVPGPAPLAIITHGSDVGRNQLRTWSALTEAHWLSDKGFAVLVLMRAHT